MKFFNYNKIIPDIINCQHYLNSGKLVIIKGKIVAVIYRCVKRGAKNGTFCFILIFSRKVT